MPSDIPSTSSFRSTLDPVCRDHNRRTSSPAIQRPSTSSSTDNSLRPPTVRTGGSLRTPQRPKTNNFGSFYLPKRRRAQSLDFDSETARLLFNMARMAEAMAWSHVTSQVTTRVNPASGGDDWAIGGTQTDCSSSSGSTPPASPTPSSISDSSCYFDAEEENNEKGKNV
ncbi:hypothetical protein DdX_14073 [Ditylenchus destructor]|uniref:Uncharacterized protein n=1 Tax=Ditylenchus destructor TaxID=166010 RepID=A0AAD4MV67_9BILA|nr:hypothetical protein DdX_14073 [Ditylenchus destructor]